MDDVFDQKENSKNIYVIRHKLNDLKRSPLHNYFEWRIGPFVVKIFPDGHGNPALHDYITQYDTVAVHVYEPYRTSNGEIMHQLLSLTEDSRFKNYQPIQYNVFESPTGSINLSDGQDMPIAHLCELIRYLHRLSNLTAFM
jgi:hypothetical protein